MKLNKIKKENTKNHLKDNSESAKLDPGSSVQRKKVHTECRTFKQELNS